MSSIPVVITFVNNGQGIINYYEVSGTRAGQGSGFTNPQGSFEGIFSVGDVVQVTASPLAGWLFDFWQATPSTGADYSNPISFTVQQEANWTLTAFFGKIGSSPPTPSPPSPILGGTSTSTFFTANHDARLLEANSLGLKPDDIMGLILLFNMRNKEGLAFLKDIIKEYLKTIVSVCGHLAQAGAANILTAYGHQILIANVLEHNYMMQAGGAGGFENLLTPLMAVSEAGSIIDGLFGGKGFDIPSTLILAGVGVPDFGSGAEAAQQTVEAKGQLMRAAQGKGESGKNPKSPHIGTKKNLDGSDVSNPSYDVEA